MNENKKMIRDLTEGSIAKLLLSFAFPLLLSNALQALYNLVDMVVVGQVLGGTGMSAVSVGGDILHLLTFIAIGFSNAGQIVIARLVGEKREKSISRMIGTMFTVLLLASLAVSGLCIVFRHGILRLMNTPAEAYADALDYTVTCAAGLVFIYGYNIVSAILRGMGDSRRPFLFIGIAAVLNTVLDIWFVAYLGLGVFGAALATVIGQGVSFLFSLVYLYRRKESFCFDFKPESFKVDPDSFSKLVRLGVPMAIQSASVNFSKILLSAWINSNGLIMSAVAGIYNKLNVVINVVASAFTAAGAAMYSQNLGAGKYRRLRGILFWVAVYSLGLSGLITLVLVLRSGDVFALFTNDTAVLAAAPVILGPCVCNFFGAAVRSVGFSVINGSGLPMLNLSVALIDGIVARIGGAALLGFGLGLGCTGFWYGDAIAGYIPLVISMVYFILGERKRRKARGNGEQDG